MSAILKAQTKDMSRKTTSHFPFAGRRSASNKMPREINRNLIFNLIRVHQSLSRADISRLSGLQRSTVSLIVDILIRERWITEGSMVRLPRGRNPTALHLNYERAVIAIDVQPAQVTVAAIDLGGSITTQNEVALPENPGRVIPAVVQAVKKIIANNNHSFDGIGISIPGRPEPSPEHPVFTPRITWSVMQLKIKLERATGLVVKMDNVANACVLSEVWFGESDRVRDLVVVNVSEGIGTGIFANGRILRGKDGMAGEFGHVQIESDGPICACGGTGCWESFASNRAAVRYHQELTRKSVPSTFESLLRLGQNGDQFAIRAIDRMSLSLGRGLRMIAAALAPAEIVVVGEITNAWYQFGPQIEAEMKRSSLPSLPRLRPSIEASRARLRSAVALVMDGGTLEGGS
jgi:predicted NBD/HSP70 family sugar kinase